MSPYESSCITVEQKKLMLENIADNEDFCKECACGMCDCACSCGFCIDSAQI